MQARLQSICEAQYELKLEEKVEIRTRKETRVGYRYNPITGTGHTYTYQVTVSYTHLMRCLHTRIIILVGIAHTLMCLG